MISKTLDEPRRRFCKNSSWRSEAEPRNRLVEADQTRPSASDVVPGRSLRLKMPTTAKLFTILDLEKRPDGSGSVSL